MHKYLTERLGLKEEIETMEGWRKIQPSKEEVDVREPKFRILSSPLVSKYINILIIYRRLDWYRG